VLEYAWFVYYLPGNFTIPSQRRAISTFAKQDHFPHLKQKIVTKINETPPLTKFTRVHQLLTDMDEGTHDKFQF
jgi:hypothetical protein